VSWHQDATEPGTIRIAPSSPRRRARHAEAVARSAKILYRGTGVERFR